MRPKLEGHSFPISREQQKSLEPTISPLPLEMGFATQAQTSKPMILVNKLQKTRTRFQIKPETL